MREDTRKLIAYGVFAAVVLTVCVAFSFWLSRIAGA